jgi:FKBP-type peptidyl-prolyl cis-trans isomerase (trigger factor)
MLFIRLCRPKNESAVTRQEIEQKMDELARKYVETNDPEIIEELSKLVRELEKLNEQSDC